MECLPEPEGQPPETAAAARPTRSKYSPEQLADAVASALSLADVLRELGLPPNGGSHAYIRSLIVAAGIDISGLRGKDPGRGRLGRRSKRLPPEARLVRDLSRPRPPNSVRLRGDMIAAGIPYVCSGCGIGPVWNDRPLTLQIDHRNGERFDNRKENLRFLCPNCHSQTDTFGVKNRADIGKSRPAADEGAPAEDAGASGRLPAAA